MKLARTAYKAAPVVVPIALAVAKYAKERLNKDDAGQAGSPLAKRDVLPASSGAGPKTPPKA
ncbi:hypothetical protein [Paracoccus shandongensis]|uniref:hypothetical protein n=1 Tax=Paracoccus shandongensis TaxID=2816048 RepID=UPI001A8DD4D9|nr:hypothetical protein [Paracoccus shandongensis]